MFGSEGIEMCIEVYLKRIFRVVEFENPNFGFYLNFQGWLNLIYVMITLVKKILKASSIIMRKLNLVCLKSFLARILWLCHENK